MKGKGAKFSYSESEFGGYRVSIESMQANTDVVFPSQYKGQDIVEIGKCLCEFCPTSITIPASVKNINKFAFSDCKLLKRVIFEEDSQIGVIEQGAFRKCEALEEINVPDTGKCLVISDWAFADCKSLKEITLPEGLIVLGEYAFSDCTSLEKITFHPDIEFPEIKKSTFGGCTALTEIVIPKEVKRIETCAFRGCTSLSKITFAEGSLLSYIGESILRETAVAELDLTPCTNLVWLESFACSSDALSKVIFPIGCNPKIKDNAFRQGAVEFVNKPHTCNIRGKNEKQRGCYVATCVYGSYDCPQVWVLRRYRDEVLASHFWGRCFIKLYYAVSPTLVRWFGEIRFFRRICKKRLDKMVSNLQKRGIENTFYDDL